MTQWHLIIHLQDGSLDEVSRTVNSGLWVASLIQTFQTGKKPARSQSEGKTTRSLFMVLG